MLVGAFSMHIFSSVFSFDQPFITINSHESFGTPPTDDILPSRFLDQIMPHRIMDKVYTPPQPKIVPPKDTPPSKPPSQPLIGSVTHLPETSIISHAPGWTLFRNIYMANGTLFILSSTPHEFPDIRMMTSTPLLASATPENIAAREPTKQSMDIITPEEARRYWGGDVKRGQRNRVWSVQGNTVSLQIFFRLSQQICNKSLCFRFYSTILVVNVSSSSPRYEIKSDPPIRQFSIITTTLSANFYLAQSHSGKEHSLLKIPIQTPQIFRRARMQSVQL